LAHKNKSLLLLFFRKEDSSFLKERSKELLLLWLSLPAPPGLMRQAPEFICRLGE
jgi:hypothetical protein